MLLHVKIVRNKQVLWDFLCCLCRKGCLLVWETSLQSSWTSAGVGKRRLALQWDCHGFTDKEQAELQKKGTGTPAISHGWWDAPVSPGLRAHRSPALFPTSPRCTAPRRPQHISCGAEVASSHPCRNVGRRRVQQATLLARSKCHQPSRDGQSSRKTEVKSFVWSCCALPGSHGSSVTTVAPPPRTPSCPPHSH